jgi:predicted deacylase
MAFLGVSAKPGEVIRARVPIGESADGTAVGLPVAVFHGVRPGPTLYIQAGLHGDELTGVEICRRALGELNPAVLSGTVVSVPLANVPAYLSRTRGFLHEERWLIDINRIFPGNAKGLLSERIANVLFNEFVQHADVTLDLHAALDGCDIAPFVYIDPDDNDGGTLATRERLAKAFGTPYAYYKPRGSKLGTSDLSRSMNAQAEAIGKPTFTAEMGESRRVSEHLVPLGVRGVHNVLRAMGMEDGAPEPPERQRDFHKIALVHAEHGGGLRMQTDLGKDVTAGEEIAQVVDVFGQTVETITAPVSGFVLRAMRLGSVATGAEIAWIAS